jgi:outer membrane protein TolC
MKTTALILGLAITCLLSIGYRAALQGQEQLAIIFPEQRNIVIRDPSHLPGAALRMTPPPRTVTEPLSKQPLPMSLDEAIRIAIDNAKTLRRLSGLNVIASGRTIYDPAIQNTQIDQARARFDPAIKLTNRFAQTQPETVFTFSNPIPLTVVGDVSNRFESSFGIEKTNVLGGTLQFAASDSSTNFLGGGELKSLDRPAVGIGYSQPLLQGGGLSANTAPLVIAQVQTEYSFFQTKDATQELVRSVIEAYWNLAFSRVDAWARRQQVEQGQEAYERAAAQLQVGLGSAAEVAQSRASLANFRADLIRAEANALQREGALRNLLGLPPYDAATIVPTTPPATGRLPSAWTELLELAGQRRPDLIELRLVLEADQQQAIIANNQAMPQLNAVAGLAWNGLDGSINANNGNFKVDSTSWSLGVNFSVPLGLREGRAVLRQKQLLIASDRANLEQGMHSAEHNIANSYRSLAQYYEQYLAYKETADAARVNLEQQMADFNLRKGLYLNVLQAISQWGDAVSSEEQALTAYNTELANMESNTGTILETHGIYFCEDHFSAIGPAGRIFPERTYPLSLPPQPGPNPIYPAGPPPKGTDYVPPEGTAPVENQWQGEPLPVPDPRPVPPAAERDPRAPAVFLPRGQQQVPGIYIYIPGTPPQADKPAPAQPPVTYAAQANFPRPGEANSPRPIPQPAEVSVRSPAAWGPPSQQPQSAPAAPLQPVGYTPTETRQPMYGTQPYFPPRSAVGDPLRPLPSPANAEMRDATMWGPPGPPQSAPTAPPQPVVYTPAAPQEAVTSAAQPYYPPRSAVGDPGPQNGSMLPQVSPPQGAPPPPQGSQPQDSPPLAPPQDSVPPAGLMPGPDR